MLKKVNSSLKNSQLGLTLIELMASLGIAAAVVVGALALYNNVSSTQRADQLSRDVVSLKAGVKSLFGGQGSYASATNALLINAGKVPSTLKVSGTTITTGDGNDISIAGTATNYTITATLVKQSTCISLLSNLTDVVSAKVDARAAVTTIPIAPGTANTECAAATSTIVITAN